MKEEDEGTVRNVNDANVSLTKELLRRVDEMVERLSTPSHRITEADAIRAIILCGLERLEQEVAQREEAVAAKSTPPS